MNVTVTAARALALLNNVVERFGADHVSTNPNGGGGCLYAVSVNGRPEAVCIVGQVIADFGLLGVLLQNDPTVEREYGGGTPAQHDSCIAGSLMWTALADAGVEFTTDAQILMRDVQFAQDSGAAWGRSVEYGIEKVVWRGEQSARLSLGLSENFASEPSVERNDSAFV